MLPGFITPCLPSKAPRPPSGPSWIHEIKHDGYRLMVRREGARVRCYTKNGHDWADRFPAIVAAAHRIKATSFLLDGEAVIPRADGMPDFNALRSQGRNHEALLYAFDLLAHDGDDLRGVALIERKQRLAELLGRAEHAIQFVEHLATTARPCSTTPAAWGWRASCRSGPMRPIAAGRRRCG